MNPRPLLVTVDVECDKGPDWRTAAPLAFDGVEVGIGQRLHPLCARLGVRPTYLLSPEVLCHAPSVALLRDLPGCELGTHLHGEYVAPGLRSLQFAGQRTDDMQWEYGADLERDKLATLTELFRQQIGRAPRSFRAGRFGIGPHTGAHLLALGYLCDSSITPFVRWTSQHGHRLPDFRDVRTDCWFVDQAGDLRQPGTSALLEIPVTIRPPINAREGVEPRWLRPWYSTREQMIALIDEVGREPSAPLCMMFHNVELIAAGSPYPQSDAEVESYLADFEAAMRHARGLGFEPMTMLEAQTRALEQRWREGGAGSHTVLAANPAPRARETKRTAAAVRQAVERSGTQDWHGYAHEHRQERWDLTEPYSWLADHLPSDAAVLDVGCGISSNLDYLHEQGFSDLSGFDIDPRAIAAGVALQGDPNAGCRLWVDDGLQPAAIPQRKFAAITAVNWTYLAPPFCLDAFLTRFTALLQPGGFLVLDAIDDSYAQRAEHRWRTSDWHKPESERRPSEYRHRFSRIDIVQAAAAQGLEVACEFRREADIPKAVYVLQKPHRPRVLFVVDAPGWAHDTKSRNLARCLEHRFYGRIVYQHGLTARELDDSDLVVIWYWRQLQSLDNLGAAIARNRGKLLMGICSHNELEGDHRQPGLSLLRSLPARVFTHSALLEAEVRPLLPGTAAICLPNGVDETFYLPRAKTRRDGPLRVGWAGSLDNFGADMRGVSTVIEPALQLLAAEHPGRFELVLAAREDRMRTPEQMRAYYQDLDVYVCASRVEGTPNPGLEAASCGVPVISTRVGNMPELIEHGINGLLTDRNPGALAAALLVLEQRPELRLAMGRRLRQTIENEWGWRTRAEGFAAMFLEVLAGSPAATAAEPSPTLEVV